MENDVHSAQLFIGDCREVLERVPADSVQCVVTSPPYWGLRDYGLPAVWWGGNSKCKHSSKARGKGEPCQGATCSTCGAWFGQLGLEPTPNLYVKHLVEVFRQVRRVLRPDGTVWLNLGDCYAGTARRQDAPGLDRAKKNRELRLPERPIRLAGLKPKDLIGLPWRVAFALQKDGWWLRTDVVWHKPNPMPESVVDRPTRAHEFIFLLAKSKHYFYDRFAMAEPVAESSVRRCQVVIERGTRFDPTKHKHAPGIQRPVEIMVRAAAKILERGTRNRRTVWTIPPQPYRGAHFAVFPEALVEPCVLASTSGKGACAGCGAPWQPDVARLVTSVSKQNGLRARTAQQDPRIKGWAVRYQTEPRLIAWKPTCSCKTGTKPCIVLDPFCGTATTGLVALKHGRSFMGIEMNPKYVELAKHRLAKISVARVDASSRQMLK